MGLCYDAKEIELFVNHVVPKFKNITYTVYGFEADPDSYKVIKDRYKDNTNVNINNLAISNSKGNVKLYKSDNGGLGNSIFPSKNNVSPFKYYEVESDTFSNWLIENNVDLKNSVNILKVKVRELEPKVSYYYELVKELNAELSLFTGTHCKKSVDCLTDLLKPILER